MRLNLLIDAAPAVDAAVTAPLAPAAGLDLRVAALAEPASVASQAGDLSGKRVLIVGSGPIGALLTLEALGVAADASVSGKVLLAF
ncbi:hypothetical protein AB0L88_14955 [Saccharopolyspora shandongensis]|uniref:Uncharacterized protein n=1 Tax=Saccharopolyspora shandongensis TaxID=418495 RepID=A0A1H3DQX4_9PSEU|nr:hypothetical protein [Saccharopolyspora shandongensis]SDX68498.1 hypothetical protein SAMN05216215_1013192 [Saccharopolyspora shandongensis]